MTFYRHSSGQITDCQISAHDRVVVVIDPESREEVERLAGELLANGIARTFGVTIGNVAAALRSFAAPSPKPDEPQGLGAVVLAHCGGGNREPVTRFGGVGEFRWIDQDGHTHTWSDLRDVEVVRRGWSE